MGPPRRTPDYARPTAMRDHDRSEPRRRRSAFPAEARRASPGGSCVKSRKSSGPSPRSSGGTGIAVVAAALIVAAIVVVYGPVRGYPFLEWDDGRTIGASPALNPPTAGSVLGMWDPRQPYMDLYVPVAYTAWASVAILA